MGIEELMSDNLLGKSRYVAWETRDKRSVAEVARDKIKEYFEKCPDYNDRYAFVTYQVNKEELGLLDRILRRDPVFEDWIFEGDSPGKIKVVPFSGKSKTGNMNLNDYLANVSCVSITFMFGSHYNGSCMIDWNNGSSRIGKIPRSE